MKTRKSQSGLPSIRAAQQCGERASWLAPGPDSPATPAYRPSLVLVATLLVASYVPGGPAGGTVPTEQRAAPVQSSAALRFSSLKVSNSPVDEHIGAVVSVGGPVLSREEVHRLVALTCPSDWSPAESEAMVKIAWKESRFNTLETCPKSSSKGLWGFLDHTRDRYGVSLDSSLEEQTLAAWLYVRDRYKSATRAWAHHRRLNWY